MNRDEETHTEATAVPLQVFEFINYAWNKQRNTMDVFNFETDVAVDGLQAMTFATAAKAKCPVWTPQPPECSCCHANRVHGLYSSAWPALTRTGDRGGGELVKRLCM